MEYISIWTLSIIMSMQPCSTEEVWLWDKADLDTIRHEIKEFSYISVSRYSVDSVINKLWLVATSFKHRNKIKVIMLYKVPLTTI